MPYLIDGYNLLHAVGKLSPRSGPSALEASRDWLRVQLESAHSGGDEVTVVFDASRTPGRRKDHPGGVVRFEYARSADSRIEDLIEADRQPGRLTVVSNDHRIQRAARRRGCVVQKCLDYVEARLLGSSTPDAVAEPPEPAAKPDGSTPEETRHWLEAFGDLGDDPLLRDPY